MRGAGDSIGSRHCFCIPAPVSRICLFADPAGKIRVRQILSGVVVLAALVAAPVCAQTADWTGVYAGADAGFAIDRFAFPYGVRLPGGFFSGDGTITSAGPVAGLDVGYQYEFADNILAGVVLDGDWASVTGSTNVTGAGGFKASFGTHEDNFATARLKLGYAIGNWAPYLTGGFGLASSRTTYAVSEPGFAVVGGSTATRSGVFPHVGAAGLGLDYALAPRLTLETEYLYDFTDARYAIYTPAPDTVVGFGTREMYHVFRIGLAWKLD
jgi:outer membrane immunogenic protein